ncbi:hypothetical protein BDZ97DRAFT_1814441 [Flammula alnicola]|nr:hypothetical protein BDZ97DRAFT_1814441 [Flammula alnicola]
MLSKVSRRVRRASVQEITIVEPRAQAVDSAPDLLRWSDFASPFPPVAYGGYTRHYVSKTPKDAEAPSYSPVLSHYPDSNSSSRDIPPRSPLFFSPSLKKSLSIIHEVSMESMAPKRPPNLTVSTNTTPTLLRRQRRRLLRTPSIERDFAVHARHLFASSLSVNDTSFLNTPSSHRSAHSHSSSSHSGHSDSNHSDSNHSDYPITPSTSIDSGDESNLFEEGRLEKGCAEEIPNRPDSRSSFSTARSGFSDT